MARHETELRMYLAKTQYIRAVLLYVSWLPPLAKMMMK